MTKVNRNQKKGNQDESKNQMVNNCMVFKGNKRRDIKKMVTLFFMNTALSRVH